MESSDPVSERPDCRAFTDLSQDHPDFHRDMEDYFQATALLFDSRSTKEVVNTDGE